MQQQERRVVRRVARDSVVYLTEWTIGIAALHSMQCLTHDYVCFPCRVLFVTSVARSAYDQGVDLIQFHQDSDAERFLIYTQSDALP